jgi:hypothetical protein
MYPIKYFRTVSPYETDKPELQEQLVREIHEEYERDKQEAEQKRARKAARYLQDLEKIRQHELRDKKPMNFRSITSQYLDEFWNIDDTFGNKLDVESFLEATNFEKLRGDTSQLNRLLYFGAGSYDRLRFWFLKKAVHESYRLHFEFISKEFEADYENETNEEMKMKEDFIKNIEGGTVLLEQLQSEVEEIAENLRESLLIFEEGYKQTEFLVKVIREMAESRYNR